MTTPKRTDEFLAYCRDFQSYKPRTAPLNPRTLSRYLRGLQLVEKLIGHSLETVSDTDQLIFMEAIMKYKQGTRRVTTQIFQRYIAWGIKEGYFTCDNLIHGNEEAIIGENTPPKYTYLSQKAVGRFFKKLKTPQLRMVFALIYYGGLTQTEVLTVTKENITKDGVFVYRAVRKESQVLPLPTRLVTELREYAETRPEKLFDFSDDIRGRFLLNQWYKTAQTETQELMGTTLRDFRTSGIRHFFELCQDIQQTKEFAGVPDNKKGWLESLVDVSSYYMRNIAKARSYHGSAEDR